MNKENWIEFCDLVKSRRRFFFWENRPGYTSEIGGLVFRLAEKLCSYSHLVENGEIVFRSRPNPNSFATSDLQLELGPPPDAKARSSRMSPAGISMFYAAEDAETAVAETADRDGQLMVGKFEVASNMSVLDLFDLSKIDDPEERDLVHQISLDMMKPISRDDRVHIDYVPTQIFTEQFKENWFGVQDLPIQGLRFPSSKNPERASYVFFVNAEEYRESKPFSLLEHRVVDVEMRPQIIGDLS